MSLEGHFLEERAWRGNRTPRISEGKDFEKALFSVPVIPKNERKDDWMPFPQAVEYAKKYQPDVLTKRPEIASKLRAQVASLCWDKDTPVKFYTAVATPLDTFHGVDAFFEQAGRRVTVDASLREKESTKADVLLHGELDAEGVAVVSDADIRSAAEAIAEKLNAASRKLAA